MMRRPTGSGFRSVFTLFDRLFALTRLVGDTKSSKPVRLSVLTLEDRLVPAGRPLPSPQLFVGGGPGEATARSYNAETGATIFSVAPFGEQFRGGMSVASADFNFDGLPDMVVAAGVGGGSRVRLYDGKTGTSLCHSLANQNSRHWEREFMVHR